MDGEGNWQWMWPACRVLGLQMWSNCGACHCAVLYLSQAYCKRTQAFVRASGHTYGPLSTSQRHLVCCFQLAHDSTCWLVRYCSHLPCLVAAALPHRAEAFKELAGTLDEDTAAAAAKLEQHTAELARIESAVADKAAILQRLNDELSSKLQEQQQQQQHASTGAGEGRCGEGQSASSCREQLEAVQAQLEAVQRQLAAADAALVDKRAAVAEADEQLSSTRRDLAVCDPRLSSMRQQVQEAEAALRAKEAEVQVRGAAVRF